VRRTNRLLAAAHDGQVLVSAAVVNVLGDELRPPLTLRALGPHRLYELTRPEDIYQLVLPGTAADFRRSERWRQATTICRSR
jgi:class 3 adenylate cyclase